ncbi:hypothetical protein B0A52_10243 [Exophiala mesophila]|uniref:DNA repair and recombination protein RAD54B n=1 Tax=Exophiala mesophila TaxID=212818 RepID=A0A438MQG6_EXOME|nr:hypothetical protein B0A52_10243 [Exophiala mesophila]
MFSKPFKPLTIKRPNTSHENPSEPPSKRKKSNPDAQILSTAEHSSRKPSHQFNERRPLKNIYNPPSPERGTSNSSADEIQSYYSVLWRIPTNKKNKTWTDDGVLTVGSGYATLYNNSGRSVGRTPFSAPLLPGSNLSLGGKEVEIDSCLTRDQYLGMMKPKAAHATPAAKIQPGDAQQNEAPKTKLSMRDQMKALMKKEKSEASRRPSQSAPSVQTSVLKQLPKPDALQPRPSAAPPKPRHDPMSPGAIVFQRPSQVPTGRQLVDVVLDPLLGKLLRPHQKAGVQFLYECVMGLRDFNGQGCILADDMGLGKTLTTIALLWTLLRQNPVHRDPPVIRKALIVCPVSLIRNWKREFKKWLGLDRLGVLEFEDQHSRVRDFDGRVYQVMIIGYERLRSVADDLNTGHPIDIVICDEGHRLKTMKSKNAQAIESLNTKRRIILSGTPIQNDLGEFFAMANFVNDGCLGSQKGFVKDFETPIMKSRQPNATPEDMERGQYASEELARTTSPFILRRTADILADFLPPKTEYVLFCKPTPAQAKIYRNVIQSPMFHSALRSNESAFQLITILKKLCNSPALMDPAFGNDNSTPSSSLVALNEMLPPGLSKLYRNSMSSKIRLLDHLLQHIKSDTSEKIVVISNYTSTLNLIEQLLLNSNLTYHRLDGSVPAKKRQGIVDKFNNSNANEAFAFLLSAKAGGVGLNLVGASRLVLFDVDWNPATDDQAIARIHRQGQKRACKIYRFLIKGGLEERIWQRQAVKRALADSIMQASSVAMSGDGEVGNGKTSTSSFSQEELRDLFRLDESEALQTHDLIGCKCDGTGLDTPTGESGAATPNEARHALVDELDGELPDLEDLLRHGETPMLIEKLRENLDTGKLPAKLEVQAEKMELMKYTHLDTSNLRKSSVDPDVNGDLASQLLSAVDDACLERVLQLDPDEVGGGGVAYLFKKTKGSLTCGGKDKNS